MAQHPEREIGDSTYRVRPLGGEDSRRIHYFLGKAVAGAVTSDRGIDMGLLWEEAKGFKIDLAGAFQALPFAEFESICKTFISYTTVTFPDGDHAPKTAKLQNVPDQMGGARQSHLIPWLRFCLEVNFGEGFFSAVRDAHARAKAKSRSESPPESTGSSGGSTLPSD